MSAKRLVGKTKARNKAIEYGRSKASEKLQELAIRARQAQSSDQTLSNPDQKILERISQ